MEPKVKAIFNPFADKGRAAQQEESMRSLLSTWGKISWSRTLHPKHATEIAKQAAQEGYQTIAAVGGDGTVHEVVNGLMQVPKERRPSLGTIPLGSGNDFCENIGAEKDPKAAAARVFKGHTKNIDIGVIADDQGKQVYWDNTLGIGFDAAVVLYALRITRLQGFSMYLSAVIQTILKNHDAPLMTIRTDKETIQDNILMITLCNGPREGGGFLVAPEAVNTDGIMDYALIENVSRAMMFRLIPEVMSGTHGRFKQVRIGRCKSVEIELEHPLPIHLDGEVYADFDSNIHSISAQLMPEELTIVL
jgi:YegS/Rv2252/BmrU family lipid kinase